jgi:SagB-type dehydrogenase family enzyme
MTATVADPAGASVVDWTAAPPLFKRYAGGPGLPLRWHRGDVAACGAARHGLGCLLRDVNGLTRIQWLFADDLAETDHTRPAAIPWAIGVRRPVPTAGTRYDGELYLATGDTGDELAGIYHYDPAHHMLRLVRPGDWRARLMAQVAGPAPTPAVVCCVTSVHARTVFKYGNLGYSVSSMDAGALSAQLVLVAAVHGQPATTFLDFQESAVEEILRLDPRSESAFVIAALGRAPARAPQPGCATLSGTGSAPSSAELALAGGVARRRAVRRGFTPEPISAGALGEVLDAAQACPDPSGEGSAGTVYCAVRRVAGVAAGIYRYTSADRHLQLVAGPAAVAALAAAAFSPMGRAHAVQAAASVFWIAGTGPAGGPDVAGGALATHSDDRTFRPQWVRTGAAAHRACVAAAAGGLASRIHCDIPLKPIAAELGLHGQLHKTVPVVTVGRPSALAERPERRIHAGEPL